MAKKVGKKSNPISGNGRYSGLLQQVYPTIARWASGHGWVEFGIDGLDRPFVRALDEGGTVWEKEAQHGSLDDALADLEEGLARFMEEQGFAVKPEAKGATRRRHKAARKAGAASKRPSKRPVDPVLKKVEKLEQIAGALRRGERFEITRLTSLKGLCKDHRAARSFAMFLAVSARRRAEEEEAPARVRELIERAVTEMGPSPEVPTEEQKERLYSVLGELVREQDEYERIGWGTVRVIHSRELLVVEKCLRAVMRPDEAPQWLYQAARDYSERYDSRYGTGLIPSSASMVEDIAGFWREYHGVER